MQPYNVEKCCAEKCMCTYNVKNADPFSLGRLKIMNLIKPVTFCDVTNEGGWLQAYEHCPGSKPHGRQQNFIQITAELKMYRLT